MPHGGGSAHRNWDRERNLLWISLRRSLSRFPISEQRVHKTGAKPLSPHFGPTTTKKDLQRITTHIIRSTSEVCDWWQKCKVRHACFTLRGDHYGLGLNLGDFMWEFAKLPRFRDIAESGKPNQCIVLPNHNCRPVVSDAQHEHVRSLKMRGARKEATLPSFLPSNPGGTAQGQGLVHCP